MVECLTVANLLVSCGDALPLPTCEIKINTFEKGFKLLFSYRLKMICIKFVGHNWKLDCVGPGPG